MEARKIILQVINSFTCIIGVALLIASIWIAIDKSKLILWTSQASGEESKSLSAFMKTNFFNTGIYFLIGIAAFILIMAVIGFFTILLENKCLAGIYGSLLIVIEIFQVINFILSATSKYDVESLVKRGLDQSFNNSYIGLPKSADSNHTFSLDSDLLMISIGCCGLNGTDDFITSPWRKSNYWYNSGRTQLIDDKNETQKIPYACCKYNSTDFVMKGNWSAFYENRKDLKCGPNLQEYNDIGCYEKLSNRLKQYLKIIMGVGGAVALLMALGVGIPCCSARN